MIREINCTVNGKRMKVFAEPCSTVLDVLRDVLHFTGTKEGCGTGDCGACTIIWNGKAVNSCLLLANRMEGAEIWTIEGLMADGKLHPIQEAFVEEGATQCGFCTPGFIMRTKALLGENPRPTDDEIKQGLVGNICRCTGYKAIVSAVKSAARKMKA
jgi:aerobic-type carbon monoxide dehydrogenase small subunit (CoxS/CutS family)